MVESILKASSLYHVYESKAEDGNVVALRGIHIDIKEGEAIAVVGPSGCLLYTSPSPRDG